MRKPTARIAETRRSESSASRGSGAVAIVGLVVAAVLAGCGPAATDSYRVEGNDEPLEVGERRSISVYEVDEDGGPGDNESVGCSSNTRVHSYDPSIAEVVASDKCDVVLEGVSPGETEIEMVKDLGGGTTFEVEVVEAGD